MLPFRNIFYYTYSPRACDNLLPVAPGRKGATLDEWTLRFWSSTSKSRGRQEGHQMVATKEDPRAIPARGRPHSLTIERVSIKLAHKNKTS